MCRWRTLPSAVSDFVLAFLLCHSWQSFNASLALHFPFPSSTNPPLCAIHSCTVSNFSLPLLGPFYALFPWCSDWCQGLVIWGNEKPDGGSRGPSVSDTCRLSVAAPRRAPPTLRLAMAAHWGRSLRSLSSPHFHFNLRLMNAEN